MSVIAFLSQKGGVGKSTLARAVAVEAARAGLSVRLADLDVSQGSLIDWHRDRLTSGIEPSPPVQLHRNLQDALSYASTVDLLILDGPAKADVDTLAIARMADLVVLPSGASLDDLRPAVRVGNSLLKAGIPSSRLIYALTRISTETEAEAAREYIVSARYQVASGYLPERPAYRTAQNAGRAVTESPYTGLRTAALGLVQAIIDALPEA
jgi:chromosome partitioning protein